MDKLVILLEWLKGNDPVPGSTSYAHPCDSAPEASTNIDTKAQIHQAHDVVYAVSFGNAQQVNDVMYHADIFSWVIGCWRLSRVACVEVS